jgi:signal transduction histidine kinase
MGFPDDIRSRADTDELRRILGIVCRVTDMAFAAVIQLAQERWVAHVGEDEIGFRLNAHDQAQLATIVCKEVRERDEIIIVDQLATDERPEWNPVLQLFQTRSCICAPIRVQDGSLLGALCTLDPKPTRVAIPQTIGMFTLCAELIAARLERLDQLTTQGRDLQHEREIARIREQFIATVGHDLRNPVQAIAATVRTLVREGGESELTSLIENSCTRIDRIVTDLLDLAAARSGAGFPIVVTRGVDLAPVLENVIAESRVIWPGRCLEVRARVTEPVSCDAARIGQLLSNLLANALTYGDAAAPVLIEGSVEGNLLRLSVVNHGAPIPPAVRARLFQPFFRGVDKGRGLGLGLYICSEIARGHTGTLTVASDANETRVTLSMPARTSGTPASLRSVHNIKTSRAIGNEWVDTVLLIADSLDRQLESSVSAEWPLPRHTDAVLAALDVAARFLNRTSAADARLQPLQAIRERLCTRLNSMRAKDP